MVTRLELTKQLHDKRKEAANVFFNKVDNDAKKTQQKLDELMVEINSIKVQLEKLGSN